MSTPSTLQAAPEPSPALAAVQRLSIRIVVGAILFSLAGTLLLRVFPSLLTVFGPYYTTLVKAPTWVYMSVLPIAVAAVYLPRVGLARMSALFFWGALIGGASELIGTTTGLPFGEYAYTPWLGPKAFGHVPYFIPLSWFAMGVVSFDLGGRVTESRLFRIVAAAAIMTLWDFSLDPAMSKAFPFWTYPNGGFFYGMPLSNWVGWFVVSLVIMAGFDRIVGGRLTGARQGAYLYVINCVFPIALSLIYGLVGASVVGAAATLGVLLWVGSLPVRLTRSGFVSASAGDMGPSGAGPGSAPDQEESAVTT